MAALPDARHPTSHSTFNIQHSTFNIRRRVGGGLMISAILLAAGQATRFGQCKQLVPIDGKPLLQHALDNLRASNVDHVVVVLGANAEEIREQIRFDNEQVVLNPDYAGGISTSIQTGLKAL